MKIVDYPFLSPEQFACCVWRQADIGTPAIAAYDILVRRDDFESAVRRFYGPEATRQQSDPLRAALRNICGRHADRLRAYAVWSGNPMHLTADQWMCSAIRPSRWTDRAFDIRQHLISGVPLPSELRTGASFLRIIRRHIGNLLAYTDYRPGGTQP